MVAEIASRRPDPDGCGAVAEPDAGRGKKGSWLLKRMTRASGVASLPVSAGPPLLGKMLRQDRIVEKIGSVGMAVVFCSFRARLDKHGRLVELRSDVHGFQAAGVANWHTLAAVSEHLFQIITQLLMFQSTFSRGGDLL
jgi:hypothetical protein